MSDYESILMDAVKDYIDLIDSINAGDERICNENWYIDTNKYDKETLKDIFQKIENQDMLDFVAELIWKEFYRLYNEGKVDVEKNELFYDDFGNENIYVLKDYLKGLVYRNRALHKARLEENEARESIAKKLKEMKGAKNNLPFSAIDIPEGEHGMKAYLDLLKRIIDDKNKEIEDLKKQLSENLISNVQSEQEKEKEPERAFNAQTGIPFLTSTQMGILMYGVALMIEKPVPGKTTIGEVVENISGFSAKTVKQNMKGAFRDADKKAVAEAIESKFPELAAKIRGL